MQLKTRLVLLLTLMASGRAMTLAFIWRAGDGGPGDPPQEWLMPLIGDAFVGLTALVIAMLIWQRRSIVVWVATIVWTSIGAFDAVAAGLVEQSTPWPEFFMLEMFGSTMFYAAAALHLVILGLLSQREVRADFGVPTQLAPHRQAAG